jgi:hyperosmotically inducible periplasmic protein
MKYALFAVALIAAGCAPEAPPAPKAAVQVAPAPQPAPVVTAPQPAPAPAAAAEPATEPKADPNQMLARKVMRALEDEAKIHAAAIDVTAHGGVVTLWGTAATPDEKQRASRVAYRVIGVTAVENKLAIASGS